jgi:hypothetical protein
VPYFHCKLMPPSPTFTQTMTRGEMALMQTHVAYWTDQAARGTAVIFGPVADPAGVWGLCVLEVTDEAELQALTANDPVILSSLGFHYEILPMLRANGR